MTSKQYFIATTDGKVEVKGYPVVIPGYEQFSFFAHHTYYKRYLNDSCESHFRKDWQISEATTGFGCMPSSWAGGMSNNTRAGALTIVIEDFKSKNREYVLQILKTAIEGAQGGIYDRAFQLWW